MNSEIRLRKLLDFIRGEGGWEHYGGGIITHPNSGDLQKALHADCLELEEQGLIIRRAEQPHAGIILWSPASKG
jgi:hypothetical protein